MYDLIIIQKYSTRYITLDILQISTIQSVSMLWCLYYGFLKII